MEPVTLRPLTPENWAECVDLAVRDDQKEFVAANVLSLAEAKIYPECVPLAIYAGKTMVGFLMYGLSRADRRFWLIRLMVDARYQGQGYGRAGLELAIREMRQLPGCRRIYLSYHPENQVGERLYASLGFLPNGEILEGEKVVFLDLDSPDV